MEEKYILAFDHGTSGMKSAIVDARGQVLDLEFQDTPIHFFPDGGAEQDPQDWWNALVATAQKLVRKNTVPAERIAAIGISSTFSSTVAVDGDGNHLMNSLTWMDSRGAPYIRERIKGFPEVSGVGLLKALKWVSKTAGGPSPSGKDDVAHVLLIQHEYPEVYQKTHMFLPSKDYLNLRLTGEFAASYDSMHLFWVTNCRNINGMHYDEALLRMAGIDGEKLPPMRPSTDILGTVKAEVADEIGIGRDVEVVVGSPDHQCACIGSGAVGDFEGHLYIGTSSWIECMVPFKKTDVFHSIASFPTAIPGKYQCINEQDLAGGCLPFLMDNILFYESEHIPTVVPEKAYEALNKVVEQVPPGSHKLIFTPWLNGERTPVDDTLLRGGFHNMSKTTNRNHMVRAVMEGVAYNTRWMLGYVEKYIGRPMTPIRIVGGGAKSSVWCRIFADVLQREIRQVEGPVQANARGAAFIALVGLGELAFDDVPGLVRHEATFEPDPDNKPVYDELYSAFIEIYKANRKIYRKLNRN
ncbi:MAG: xylulose kinase [Proteobacteria bacterium]|nr:xylulose kinase [Pseudomonadota bacterium]